MSGLWFSISEICGPRAAPNLSQAVQQYKLFDAGAQLQLGFAHFVSFGYAIAVTFPGQILTLSRQKELPRREGHAAGVLVGG
jgi:hypothetical protein